MQEEHGPGIQLALQVSEQYNNIVEKMHINHSQIPEQKLIDNLVEKYF
jgi:hypothetical protein